MKIVFNFNFHIEGLVCILVFFAFHNLKQRSYEMVNKVLFRNNVNISLAEKTLLKLFGVAPIHTMEGDWYIILPPYDSFLRAKVYT